MPLVECVDINSDGSMTAYFGYRNDSALQVNIASGSMNMLLPPPAEGVGLPESFSPGRFVNAFSANTFGESLLWILGDRSAEASFNSPRCCPGLVDLCGVCNGNERCIDCLFEPNPVIDKCGVCGGDGKSCLGCITLRFADIFGEIEAAKASQQKMLAKALKRLAKAGASDPKARKLIMRAKKLGDKTIPAMGQILDLLSAAREFCNNSSLCQYVSRQSRLEEYKSYSLSLTKAMTRLARKRIKLIGFNRPDRKLLVQSLVLQKVTEELLKQVPSYTSSCRS